VRGLNRPQLVEESVIDVIADLRVVEDVVAIAVIVELAAQLDRPRLDVLAAGRAQRSLTSSAAGAIRRVRS
jgi:hypothetical protein